MFVSRSQSLSAMLSAKNSSMRLSTDVQATWPSNACLQLPLGRCVSHRPRHPPIPAAVPAAVGLPSSSHLRLLACSFSIRSPPSLLNCASAPTFSQSRAACAQCAGLSATLLEPPCPRNPARPLPSAHRLRDPCAPRSLSDRPCLSQFRPQARMAARRKRRRVAGNPSLQSHLRAAPSSQRSLVRGPQRLVVSQTRLSPWRASLVVCLLRFLPSLRHCPDIVLIQGALISTGSCASTTKLPSLHQPQG